MRTATGISGVTIPESSSILACLSKPGVRDKVLSELSGRGIPTHTPCLKLEISSTEAKNFHMEESDAFNVFGRFGEIRSLKVLNNVVLILYKDITSAYFSQKILNGRHLPEFGITLRISWYHNQEDSHKTHSELPHTEPPYTAAKSTCRFDIQIPNDKHFQVARRLIGPKGLNMKKIVETCCGSMTRQAHDVVKLRLRGKGSGFKEGPMKEESKELLHMCVSSKYQDKYALAVAEVEKLIKRIYLEYDEYCGSLGYFPAKLQVRKCENLSGRSEELWGKKYDSHEVDQLIDIRNEARRQLNFEQADRIRDVLKERGVVLLDERGARRKDTHGTTWKYCDRE